MHEIILSIQHSAEKNHFLFSRFRRHLTLVDHSNLLKISFGTTLLFGAIPVWRHEKMILT